MPCPQPPLLFCYSVFYLLFIVPCVVLWSAHVCLFCLPCGTVNGYYCMLPWEPILGVHVYSYCLYSHCVFPWGCAVCSVEYFAVCPCSAVGGYGPYYSAVQVDRSTDFVMGSCWQHCTVPFVPRLYMLLAIALMPIQQHWQATTVPSCLPYLPLPSVLFCHVYIVIVILLV